MCRCFVFFLILAVTLIHSTVNKTLFAEDVLVTAERIETPEKNLSTSFHVITATDLSNNNVTNAQEALFLTGSFSINSSGGSGALQTVNIRGTQTNQMVVLVNGIEMQNPIFNSLDLSNILVGNIERIEIIKGSQSVLYGANAMGGVINIITKSPEDLSTNSFKNSASLYGGSYKSYGSNFSTEHKQNKVSFLITAHASGEEGISSATNDQGIDEKDGFHQQSESTRIVFTPKNDLSFEMFQQYLHKKIELDSSSGTTGDAKDFNNIFENHIGNLSCTKKFLNNLVEGKYTFSVNQIELSNHYEPPNLGYANYKAVSFKHAFQNIIFFNNINSAIIGFENKKDQNKLNQTQYDKNSISTQTILFNHLLDLSDYSMSLNYGARYEHNSMYKEKVLYKAGANYKLNQNVSFRTNYSTGFRAPSITEGYSNLYGAGNKDLKPESSKNYEIGSDFNLINLNKYFDSLVFKNSITLFYTDFSERISYSTHFINEGAAVSKGIEYEFKQTTTSNSQHLVKKYFSNIFNITKNWTKDKSTGGQLTNIPKTLIKYKILYSFTEKFNIGIQSDYKSSRKVYGGNLPDRLLFNFDTSYQFKTIDNTNSNTIKLWAKIDNLLDKKYNDAISMNAYGRFFKIGITSNF